MIELKRSGYIATPLDVPGWTKVVDYFSTTPNAVNLAIIEPYGVAIEKYPVANSAFIHRDVDMDFFVDSFFADSHDFTTRAQAQEWVDGDMEVLQPYLNGHVYQNYPERGLANYKLAYWGSALRGPEKLKAQVDEEDFFHFEQGV